ncbi:MAG: aconitate hydratase AcnA [Candidatus Wallbacteria bacterium]|nr:aconitate hydratase AcnA [Candidatus Wallbacteria bacterium]
MLSNKPDHFQTRSQFKLKGKTYDYYSLPRLAASGLPNVHRLPVSLRVLLENLLRHQGGPSVSPADVQVLAGWNGTIAEREISFMPARVLLQDFTGVPAVVDLAAMRDAIAAMGGDPGLINPLRPADLVIDHSVQIDSFGTAAAFWENANLEMERNRERYVFLRWGQKAFANFRVVPPDTGIVHQVNLEYLASAVFVEKSGRKRVAYPDTLVGTDSHTTMINGLGVLGWGVGGIEAEAVLLGQPMPMLIPDVIGFRLEGELPAGATATDLVLTVTQMLRARGVVGRFVEFFGPGVTSLSLPDRATIANMAPEYGATVGFFPIDAETLSFLRFSGRDRELVELVEAYTKEQGLFRTDESADPVFTDVMKLDLATVVPSLAGPRRPQDRVPLSSSKADFRKNLAQMLEAKKKPADSTAPVDPSGAKVTLDSDGVRYDLKHGSVVIAAITSCTNTSNPSVLMAAGLLARNAVHHGLQTRPWVKTSLAPGSKVVTDYLRQAGLLPYLEALRFHAVGYGCTTCIGNSGPIPEPISRAIPEGDLVVAAVLSGNRNFEARISPQVKMNYLASPPLVVAYALAGTMDIDLASEPIGHAPGGKPVFLKDIWPSNEEVAAAVKEGLRSEMFEREYGNVFEGPAEWATLPVPEGDRYAWDGESTYIKKPPYFEGMTAEPGGLSDISGARVLAMLGHSVTTDHISPAGNIKADSPAGKWLQERGVAPKDFNSYGARRGNHEVMIRGTFANVRLKNFLAGGVEGGVTVHLPDEAPMTIYDASVRYQADRVPLVVIAGKEYGTGSSRDWAAKGTRLLGVNAVIAESFERIHRSNLIGMGVLPCEFLPGESRETLGLTGKETYEIGGIATGMEPGKLLTVRARSADGQAREFRVKARVDTPVELDYYRHGGILQFVLRGLVKQ